MPGERREATKAHREVVDDPRENGSTQTFGAQGHNVQSTVTDSRPWAINVPTGRNYTLWINRPSHDVLRKPHGMIPIGAPSVAPTNDPSPVWMSVQTGLFRLVARS